MSAPAVASARSSQRESDADAFTLDWMTSVIRVDEAVTAPPRSACGTRSTSCPGHAYFDIAAEVKRRPVHLHAFSPMEVVNGATRSNMSIGDWLRAAPGRRRLDSGNGMEIPDDDVRWVLTKGQVAGTGLGRTSSRTAHGLGLPLEFHDDVRPRRLPSALGRPPSQTSTDPARYWGFTSSWAAVRASQCADLPGFRPRPTGGDPARGSAVTALGAGDAA